MSLIQTASAHCDLPCGVYDPAQAKIEAMSVLKSMEKYNDSDDHDFKARCTIVKEQRAEEVKHHLWVLWTDFFKPHHLEADASIHELMWNATKVAGEAKKDQRHRQRPGTHRPDRPDQRKVLEHRRRPRSRRLRPVEPNPAPHQTARLPSPPAQAGGDAEGRGRLPLSPRRAAPRARH